MDFKELAKIAAAKKKSSTSTPEEKIERLKRSLAREKAARQQAEKTIEQSSRRLYLANQVAALNKVLESTLQNLNETLEQEQLSLQIESLCKILTRHWGH